MSPIFARIFRVWHWLPWLCHPFTPNLQDITNPKPLELGSWIFERLFTPHHMSHATCHISHVSLSDVRCQESCVTFFHFFSWQSGWGSLGRVCYQWGLPRLVYLMGDHHLMMESLSSDTYWVPVDQRYLYLKSGLHHKISSSLTWNIIFFLNKVPLNLQEHILPELDKLYFTIE